MRSLDDLINTEEPGLLLLEDWISRATNSVVRLPCEGSAGERALLALQVTTRSPLGAIAFETGGLLVDDGWIRILGAGCSRLPRALDRWNRVTEDVDSQRFPGAFLIGDDVLGGFFALNGGALGPQPRPTVWYLPPDTLEWEDSELGYSEWLNWTFAGDLDHYYLGMRWSGWEQEIRDLSGDRGLSVYPFPWAKEGGPIAERSRRPVPIQELWHLHACDFPRQMGLPYVHSPE